MPLPYVYKVLYKRQRHLITKRHLITIRCISIMQSVFYYLSNYLMMHSILMNKFSILKRREPMIYWGCKFSNTLKFEFSPNAICKSCAFNKVCSGLYISDVALFDEWAEMRHGWFPIFILFYGPMAIKDYI